MIYSIKSLSVFAFKDTFITLIYPAFPREIPHGIPFVFTNKVGIDFSNEPHNIRRTWLWVISKDTLLGIESRELL